MRRVDYLSSSHLVYMLACEDFNEKLARRGLSADDVISIIEHRVDGHPCGFIAFFKTKTEDKRNKNT